MACVQRLLLHMNMRNVYTAFLISLFASSKKMIGVRKVGKIVSELFSFTMEVNPI